MTSPDRVLLTDSTEKILRPLREEWPDAITVEQALAALRALVLAILGAQGIVAFETLLAEPGEHQGRPMWARVKDNRTQALRYLSGVSADLSLRATDDVGHAMRKPFAELARLLRVASEKGSSPGGEGAPVGAGGG